MLAVVRHLQYYSEGTRAQSESWFERTSGPSLFRALIVAPGFRAYFLTSACMRLSSDNQVLFVVEAKERLGTRSLATSCASIVTMPMVCFAIPRMHTAAKSLFMEIACLLVSLGRADC